MSLSSNSNSRHVTLVTIMNWNGEHIASGTETYLKKKKNCESIIVTQQFIRKHFEVLTRKASFIYKGK